MELNDNIFDGACSHEYAKVKDKKPMKNDVRIILQERVDLMKTKCGRWSIYFADISV